MTVQKALTVVSILAATASGLTGQETPPLTKGVCLRVEFRLGFVMPIVTDDGQPATVTATELTRLERARWQFSFAIQSAR